MRFLSMIFIFALVIAGCDGTRGWLFEETDNTTDAGLDSDTDSDIDTDVDTDADGDSDGDSDTDSDSDTDTDLDSGIDGYTDAGVDLGSNEVISEMEPFTNSGCVRYVDGASTATAPDGTSWATAYTKIQEGIDAAFAGRTGECACQVWVTSGNYSVYKTSPDDTLQLKEGVAVMGGFDGTETELGDRKVDNSATDIDGGHLVYGAVRAAHFTLLENLTITGGGIKKCGQDCGYDGGGIIAVEVGETDHSMLVKSCIFRDNYADSGGAILTNFTSMRIYGSLFIGNEASGGTISIINGGGLTVDGSFFLSSNGLAIYGEDSTVVLSDSVFVNNGGGVFQQSTGTLSCNKSVFVANGPGKTLFAENLGEVSNTHNIGNTGIPADGEDQWAKLNIRNSNLLFNKTTAASTCDISNSIVWGNSSGVDSDVNVTYSNVQGSVEGTGNISTDPGFIGSPLSGGGELEGTYKGVHVTAFKDEQASWSAGVFSGFFVKIDGDRWHYVLDNTSNELVVLGNFTGGDSYSLYDFHLAQTSPCVDAASYDENTPQEDYDGKPRVDIESVPDTGFGDKTYVDMGCYEFQQKTKGSL